jgi:hypothetical protein
MIVIEMLAWWYTEAWIEQFQAITGRITRTLESFSVGLLTQTLFAPFRQIDAGNVRGSLEVQVRAWFDRTFSRFFGFIVRSIVIFAGCIAALAVGIVSIAWVIVWIFIPILPLIGLAIMLVAGNK